MNDCNFSESLIGGVIGRYLRLKTALGRRPEKMRYILTRLDRFLMANHFLDLSLESFSAWCASFHHLHASTRLSRMRMVYHLCLFRRRDEPNCFLPDPSQFPPAPPRRPPYILSSEEISRLLLASGSLHPNSPSPLHRLVARLAVVLAYTTGLRRSELVRLTLKDYEPSQRVLLIRESKFYKSRLLPLSADAGAEIEKYLLVRRHSVYPCRPDSPLLLHNHGPRRAYSGPGIGSLMRKIFRVAGVQTPAGRLPRFHDLRFTFAVQALLRWYQAGVDVQARLPSLSAYMGHASIVSTQYYLRFCESIAGAACERFDTHCSKFLLSESSSRGGK